MMDAKGYRINPDATISDIDLDEEEFVLADGTRLTEAEAEQLAAKTLAEIRERNLVPGRKSLARDGTTSPIVQFRSPRRAEAQAVADEMGVSLSQLARDALDNLLDEVAASSKHQ